MKRHLLAMLVSFLLTLGCGGVFSTSGPWGGDQTLVVRLAAEDAPASDVEVLRERLGRLAIDHTLTGDEKEVEITLWRVSGPELLDQLIQPMQVRIAFPGDDRVLSNEHVQTAELSGRTDVPPTIELTFTEAGGRTFCELTRAHIGENLELLVDGRGSTPMVREPICGGRAQLQGPGLWEATVIAAAVQGPPLAGAWTVASVELGP